MSLNYLLNLSKNKELAEKFRNKSIFLVNHTSFYGKLFEKYFAIINDIYNLNIEYHYGSRENGFDILNKKDIDFWSYKESDIIIYPGVDFSDYKDIDNQITTSVNLVTGIANLLEKKKESCIFYTFDVNVSDLLYCTSIYSALALTNCFFKIKKNCFQPYIPIYRENFEYCFEEMIKDIVKKIK